MKQTSTTSYDETYFDKPRIIRLTKKMLAKLRRKKILVDDIVQHINNQGIHMTRARFEDLFTSRPNRVTIATPTTILAFINACFDFDNRICTAEDIVNFADAARLPLRFYNQLAIYFSTAEWQSAWFGLLPTTKPLINRHQLVHRRDEFNRMMHACTEGRHVFITGEAGIGKTAMAQSLVIELEMINKSKIATLYLSNAPRSLADLTQMLAQALNIKPLDNEPIELRMQSVISKTPVTYVFIDNYPLTSSELTILLALIRRFRQMRVIVTTTDYMPPTSLADLSADIYVEQLSPLFDGSTNSPAMLLFIQALSNYGFHYANDDLPRLHGLCKQAHGNPLRILQLASMHSTDQSAINEQSLREYIEHMNPTELAIFTFLAIIENPLSHIFVVSYFKSTYSVSQIEQSIQTLIQHNMLERLYNEQQFSYRITQRLRITYNENVPQQRRLNDYEQHIVQLARYTQTHSLEVITTIRHSDMFAILGFVQRVVAQHVQLLFDAVKLIVNWLQIWLYHDASSHVIVFAEQILMQHRISHPTLAELCVTMGRIYNVRGQYDQALRLQHTACQYVSPQHYPHIWAQSMIVQLNTYTSINDMSSMLTQMALIPDIIAHLEAARHRDWLSFAYHVISNAHATRQDITLAITANETSIQWSTDQVLTVAYIVTHFQRSLLYMYAGGYDIAYAVLSKLQDEIAAYDIPYYTARLHMRMAAIEALLRNTTSAQHHIIQSFEVLKSVGNLGELLFVADIYSLILYRDARYQEALAISNLCSKLRNEYDIKRASYIEQLVERKRNNIAPDIRNHAKTPAADSTIYDLLEQLTDIYSTLTPKHLSIAG